MAHYFLGGFMPQEIKNYILTVGGKRKYALDKKEIERLGGCTCHDGAYPIIRELHFFEIDINDYAAPAFEREFIQNYFAPLPQTGFFARLAWLGRWLLAKFLGRKITDMGNFQGGHNNNCRNFLFFKIADCMEENTKLHGKNYRWKCQKCGGWHYVAHF